MLTGPEDHQQHSERDRSVRTVIGPPAAAGRAPAAGAAGAPDSAAAIAPGSLPDSPHAIAPDGPHDNPPESPAGDLADTAATVDSLVGQVVGGCYLLVARIGEGGMGTVYRAEHTQTGEQLAVKLLHRDLTNLEEMARRFEREARLASLLDHPGCVRVSDFGRTEGGSLFLAMELLDGEPLSVLLAREGRLPVARTVAIARQVLAALGRAHAMGVVHRDLKPDNIMLAFRSGTPGAVKIVDFGIAKVLGGEVRQGGSITQAGIVFGTPEYIAPEQALGDAVDGRADLYALGAILFEMLTGRRLFAADEKLRLVGMHLTQPPPALRQAAPDVDLPAALEAVVARALEKRRGDRFADAAEFLEALEAAVAPGASLAATSLVASPSLSAVEGDSGAAPAAAAASVSRAGQAEPISVAESGASPPALAGQFRGAAARSRWRSLSSKLARSSRALREAARAAGGRPRLAWLASGFVLLSMLAAALLLVGVDRGAPPPPSATMPSAGQPQAALAPAVLALPQAIGRSVLDALIRLAGHGPEPRLRHQALAAVASLGEIGRVDRVSSYRLDAQQMPICTERRAAVRKLGELGELGDRRALVALRQLRPVRGRAVAGPASDSACIQADVDAAIAALQRGPQQARRPSPRK